ncbi:MAG: aminopeptidase [Treponemataceae bacterium]|nr:MAG: aminopeptidase [Treponemataceae bacterium]
MRVKISLMEMKMEKIIPCAVSLILLVLLLFLCSACYTLKQGTQMLGYLRRAVPLEKLPPSDADFAARIYDIRRFASEELGLKPTKNYTKYVEIDRDYLCAVVSACAKDSFTGYEWRFPIVGAVPYKGFFDTDGAKKLAKQLEEKDLDVWVRPVEAFSTLGYFRDPLYSFMKKYSDYELADLIIHESFHATLFLPNNAQFNEELAEFVGSEGAKRYIASRFGKNSPVDTTVDTAIDTTTDTKIAQDENKAYVAYIHTLITELSVVYESNISREEKLEKKAQIIAKSQKTFAETYADLFPHDTTDRFKGFSTIKINNAFLELYRIYHGSEGNYFLELYTKSGLTLPEFIQKAVTLKTMRKKDLRQPRQALEAATRTQKN